MGRKKGDGLGKTGGRVKGTPNKITALSKELIKDFAVEKWPEFKKAWSKIESNKDKADIYLKMLQYILPKMSSVDVSGKIEKPSWEDELKELSDMQ